MALTLTVLGSGSDGNAAVVGCDGLYILIDAGFSRAEILRRMAAAGIDPTAVCAVLLTHEHADHLAGARVLCDSLNIPLCLAGEVVKYLRAKRRKLPGKLQVFTPGDTFMIAGFEIASFPTMHDTVAPVGFTVSHSGRKLGIATDIGVAGESVLCALQGCHALFWESSYDLEMLRNSNRSYRLKRRIMSAKGHLGNLDSAKALARLISAETTALVLGHISRECNTYAIAEAAARAALAELGREDVALYVARQEEVLNTIVIGEDLAVREYHHDLLVWAGCET